MGGEKLLRLLSREPEAQSSSINGHNNLNNGQNASAAPTSGSAPSSGSVAAFFAQATRQEQTPFGNFVLAGKGIFFSRTCIMAF